jgi:hypothetical protein
VTEKGKNEAGDGAVVKDGKNDGEEKDDAGEGGHSGPPAFLHPAFLHPVFQIMSLSLG